MNKTNMVYGADYCCTIDCGMFEHDIIDYACYYDSLLCELSKFNTLEEIQNEIERFNLSCNDNVKLYLF